MEKLVANILVVLSALLALSLVAAQRGGDPRSAKTLKWVVDIAPEGSYQWAYETDNGIAADEKGDIKVTGPETADKKVQGSFKFTSPENEAIQIQYVADENGFQPTGNAIPTPPPVPALILRALEWIAAHPQREEPSRLGR